MVFAGLFFLGRGGGGIQSRFRFDLDFFFYVYEYAFRKRRLMFYYGGKEMTNDDGRWLLMIPILGNADRFIL